MEKHIKFLQDCIRRFDSAEVKSKYLNSKKEQKSEKMNMEKEILNVQNYLITNDELHQIFMKEHLGFLYEEALTKIYFSRDFHLFIETLKKNN